MEAGEAVCVATRRLSWQRKGEGVVENRNGDKTLTNMPQ